MDKMQDLDSLIASMEQLEQLQEKMQPTSQIGLESMDASFMYIYANELNQIRLNVGLEALEFQDVKDMFSAMGRTAVAMGEGFMKFLNKVHEIVDSTYLVKTKRIRKQFEALGEAQPRSEQMERPGIGKNLSIGGQFPENFAPITKDLIEFSKYTTSSVIPVLASMTRQCAARLEAKRFLGNDAFQAEVMELAAIIAASKSPMQLYSLEQTQELYPGNRSIFNTIKPKRPSRPPNTSNAAARKVVEAVSHMSIGIVSNPKSASGKGPSVIPVLFPAEALRMLNYTDALLNEVLRVNQAAKPFRKDKHPSTMSLMLSGFYHGVSKTFDDFWTSSEDGFGEFEGAQGGEMRRIQPGKKGMMGVMNDGMRGVVSNLSMEAKIDDEERSVLAVWVSRYLKLTAVDHIRTAQSLQILLLAVARGYIEYIEESLKYYEQK